MFEQIEELIEKEYPVYKPVILEAVANIKQIINDRVSQHPKILPIIQFFQENLHPDYNLKDFNLLLQTQLVSSHILDKLLIKQKLPLQTSPNEQFSELMQEILKYQEIKKVQKELTPFYQWIEKQYTNLPTIEEKLHSVYHLINILDTTILKNKKTTNPNHAHYPFFIRQTNAIFRKHFNRNLHDAPTKVLFPGETPPLLLENFLAVFDGKELEKQFSGIHLNEAELSNFRILKLLMEQTYFRQTRENKIFENLCWTDIMTQGIQSEGLGLQANLFGIVSENQKKIQTQNLLNINLIIADLTFWMKKYTSSKNYPDLDNRISKSIDIKKPSAQLVFLRCLFWVINRLKGSGMISLLIPRELLELPEFEKLRKKLSAEFDFIYVIDLQKTTVESSSAILILVSEY